MQIILVWGEANKQKNEKLCTINHNNNKKKSFTINLSFYYSKSDR